MPSTAVPAADCLIIGGGPAGLSAAIYAARFRLGVRLVDAGHSRAALIPCTRNHAGFPDGISGVELLGRIRDHAARFGVAAEPGWVTALTPRPEGGFVAEIEGGAPIAARAVILATGVRNRRPPMDDDLHAEALARGRLRYCPLCDGFEVIDQNLAVIGTGARGTCEAVFLRSYSDRVTLVAPDGAHDLNAEAIARLEAAGAARLDGPADHFRLEPHGLSFNTGAGRMTFEAVYPALGSDVHCDLVEALGADITDEGCLRVDAHQRTSVAGLYAAGDVTLGLDQISHAMGEAAVAATTLRNDLKGVG